MAKEEPIALVMAREGASLELARQSVWATLNMTGLERDFWKLIGKDSNPWGFIPQFPMMGYLLDFYCPFYQVAVEMDGPLHAKQRDHDQKRDKVLALNGIHTIRLTGMDLLRHGPKGIYDYLEGVFKNVELPAPTPPPPAGQVPDGKEPVPEPPHKPRADATPFD